MSLNTYIDSCVSGFEEPFKIVHVMDFCSMDCCFTKPFLFFLLCYVLHLWDVELGFSQKELISTIFKYDDSISKLNKLINLLRVLLIVLVGGYVHVC
jgi:hypothetical protein